MHFLVSNKIHFTPIVVICTDLEVASDGARLVRGPVDEPLHLVSERLTETLQVGGVIAGGPPLTVRPRQLNRCSTNRLN